MQPTTGTGPANQMAGVGETEMNRTTGEIQRGPSGRVSASRRPARLAALAMLLLVGAGAETATAQTTCPSFSVPAGHTQVWTGTVTVGEVLFSTVTVGHGFVTSSSFDAEAGDLSVKQFDFDSISYTITNLYVRNERVGGTAGELSLSLSSAVPEAQRGRLQLHVCGESFALADAQLNPGSRYSWPTAGLDWSSETSRVVYLTAGPVLPVFDDENPRYLTEHPWTGSPDFGYPVTATDPNGETVTYSIEGADAASFAIDSATGQLRTKRGVSYDYETKPILHITVRATTADGRYATRDIEVQLANIDERYVPNAQTRATGGRSGSLTVTWDPSPGHMTRTEANGYTINEGRQWWDHTSARGRVTQYEVRYTGGGSGLLRRAVARTEDYTCMAQCNEDWYDNQEMIIDNLTPGTEYTVQIRGRYPHNPRLALDAGHWTTMRARTSSGPNLQSSRVTADGRSVELTFSENLDTTGPGANAFQIYVDAVIGGNVVGTIPVSANSVSVSGRRITLQALSRTIRGNFATTTRNVRVMYTDPSAGNDPRAIQDTGGNDVTSFTTGRGVLPATTNGSTVTARGTNGPEPVGANVRTNGNRIDITWDETIHIDLPPKEAFTVRADGVPITIGTLVYGITTLGLNNLDPDIGQGQTVTVSYDRPTSGDRITDSGRNWAESFTNLPVTNGSTRLTSLLSTQAPPPLIARFSDLPESHDGESAFEVKLTFSQALMSDFHESALEGLLEVQNGSVTGTRPIEGTKKFGITITPANDGDVSFTLPVTSNCATSLSVCTGEDQPVHEAVTVQIDGPTTVEANTPFTVEFVNAPDSHDGDDDVTFEVHFSKNPSPYGWRTLRDHTLQITQGSTSLTAKKTKRMEKGSNQRWSIEVEPVSKEDMFISIAPTSSCSDAGAVCTGDSPRQNLSTAQAHVIQGPPSLSVADAQATEGTDATMDFVISLSRPASEMVSFQYATSDGTATEGTDYGESSSTVALFPGLTTTTVSVQIIDDAIDEGSETFTLTLSNASGGDVWIADGTATGTIDNDDHMPSAWLSRFGRTVASQAVDAIGGRMQGDNRSHVTVAGQSFSSTVDDREELEEGAVRVLDPLAPDEAPGTVRSMSGQELLLGSSFQLSSGAEAGKTAWTAWGEVGTGGFEAQEDDTRLDGNVTTAFFGGDVGNADWLAGVAVSMSEGDGDYALIDNDVGGEVESSLTTVYPYGRLALSNRLDVWAFTGLGQGDLTLTHEAESGMKQVYRPDIDLTMGAIGTRGEVLSPTEDGELSIAIKSDAFWVRTSSDAVRGSDGNLEAAETDVSRLRLLVEGSRTYDTGGGKLTPTLEIGIRHDGGDAETGTGIEAGAGLRYIGDNVTIQGNVRTLIAHEDSGYEEWGASGSVRVEPGPSGRGLSFTLTPSWGAASSGTGQLWSLRDASALTPDGEFEGETESRLDAELGYGLGHAHGVVTPFAAMTFGDGRNVRTGARWQWSRNAAFGLEARRDTGYGNTTETGVRLEARVRF